MTSKHRIMIVALFLSPLMSTRPASAQYCGDSLCDVGEEWCTTDCGTSAHCGDYGMSVAPNYPSNCRDITDSRLQDFCYSVSSWGSWANCSGVSNAADKALCQALTYRSSSYCANITNSNDRWFCYGASSRINSYCGNIVY